MGNDWLSAPSTLVIGHRGASASAPENTLAAFNLALEQGADGIELDVRLSADGRLVVIHDTRVDRTTDGIGEVANLTLSQIQSLDCGEGQKIPTLDEVFDAFGAALLYNLELKMRSRGKRDSYLSAVADLIESYNLQHRVVVSTFSPLLLRRCRSYIHPPAALALLRWPGLGRFGYLLADGQADHPHHRMIDESYVVWARRRGYRIHTWTVDDPDRARYLADLGVNGIITNHPARIRDYIALK